MTGRTAAVWIVVAQLLLAVGCGGSTNGAVEGGTPTLSPGAESEQRGEARETEPPYQSFAYTYETRMEIVMPDGARIPGLVGRVTGEFVAQDSHRFTGAVTFIDAGTHQVTIIGDRAWVGHRNDPLVRNDPIVLEQVSNSSAEERFPVWNDRVSATLAGLRSGFEMVDGISAAVYEVPPEHAPEVLVAMTGQELDDARRMVKEATSFELAVWVDSESQTLVRFDLRVRLPDDFRFPGGASIVPRGGELAVAQSFALSRINDPTILIPVPPAATPCVPSSVGGEEPCPPVSDTR